MSWKMSLALKGDLQLFMDAEVKAGQRAVTSVIRTRTTNLKNALRRQVIKAGLGIRLGKAIRGNTYPRRGNSLGAAGYVTSKALVKREHRATDLITLFDEGAIVFPLGGKRFISIQNPDVIPYGPGFRGRPHARAPSDFPEGTFIFKPTKKASVAVLVKKEDPSKVAFWLVKLAKIPKKLDINKAYQKAIRGLDVAVVRAWERNTKKIEGRFGVDL